MFCKMIYIMTWYEYIGNGNEAEGEVVENNFGYEGSEYVSRIMADNSSNKANQALSTSRDQRPWK